MKLIVPYIGELQTADARLIRLAEFLGIRCEPLRLEKQVQARAEYIERAVPDQNSCLLVNPQVMREWVGGNALPADVVSCLVSHFPRLLLHGVTRDAFVDGMMVSLSNGRLRSIQPVADAGQPYEISSNSKDFCGPFSGLSFGPINAANDRVFAVNADDESVRKLISIGGHPLMAAVKRDKTEILFLASEDTADINAEVGYAPLTDYFSRLIPHAMALRQIFGEECWRPDEPHASIIVDDPLLQRDYGYLNFEFLLRLTQKYNFHTTIAFIPHNYRRNSARIIRMFRENSDRLSICFHGNDHTAAELASTDTAFLNTMLGIAEERMNAHEQTTGLRCEKVMVFPQGRFSVEAMEVLKSRNFHAAVNTVHAPVGQQPPLTIADFAQPAVLRYGGFPLFIRTYVKKTQSQDIAFNLFFGRPVLIVEHHDIFRHPESLVDVVQKVNSIAPGIFWSNLESAVDNSILRRRAPDETVQVRAYSSNVHTANDSAAVERFSIEWGQPGKYSAFEQVLRDGVRLPGVDVDDAGIRVSAELAPHTSQTFSVLYRSALATHRDLGFRWNAKAFLRRRLSEVRDNYLSRNQYVLTVAKSLRHRFLN
jgi:hypothetical protein